MLASNDGVYRWFGKGRILFTIKCKQKLYVLYHRFETYMTTNALQHLNLTLPADDSSRVMRIACALEYSHLAVMIAFFDDRVVCLCDSTRCASGGIHPVTVINLRSCSVGR